MRFFNNNISYSPTDLVRFFESEFTSYMDHFEKTVSKKQYQKVGAYKNPPDPLSSIIIDMGHKHEEHLINKLEKKEPLFRVTNTKDRTSAINETLLAMKDGKKNIYQAALKKDIFFGFADLLIKQKGTSFLGDYLYIPYDFKLSKHPKPQAIIQLCCYCDILESLQGLRPPFFAIVTKDEKNHLFKTNDFFYFYSFLKHNFLTYHQNFNPYTIPIPDKTAEHRDWSLFAKSRLIHLDDIFLVANIRSSHVSILRKNNIHKMSELSMYEEKNIPGISKSVLKNLKDQAQLQISSIKQKKLKFKILPHEGKRHGLEILPPPCKQDVFLDKEGYPLLGTEGLEYLYGNVINIKPYYISFLASDKSEEKKVFKECLDWLYSLWKKKLPWTTSGGWYCGSHMHLEVQNQEPAL